LVSDSTPSGTLDEFEISGANEDDGRDTDTIRDEIGGASHSLGFELDFKLFFDSDDGFHAWFQYGLFIPMDAMDRLVPVSEDRQGDARYEAGGEFVERIDASLAHTLQLMLGITF
jgi:hypothetical protein